MTTAGEELLRLVPPPDATGGTVDWERVDAAVRGAELLEQMSESLRERVPYDIDHLLAAGKTDNGDTIYWFIEPEDAPNQWTVTANGARNTKWPHFEGGIVDFLVAILSGAPRLDMLPSGFLSARPAFAPEPEPEPETVRRRPRARHPDRSTPEGAPG
ncbi:hypothetical protein EDD90_4574 [Streptomyces sp. Ag109_O5-1]|uniref:hypothetical protein n=1 Tax=Streptomyces sp. Ag109_O5-1 TaxID=1938851 RepID=UPI000F4FDBAF|nr:hypothetical protein [Streptomyces sp. Ag109_O5-1]RPE41488.1 hypothetical protein EDD90_4574 [Streptomyces sp. Ag109_O5-1]